ncbi:hypothetical protein EON67_06540 [archaeon]|nr:MAG: hypothetical protein EON67_06540 [archaeon]
MNADDGSNTDTAFHSGYVFAVHCPQGFAVNAWADTCTQLAGELLTGRRASMDSPMRAMDKPVDLATTISRLEASLGVTLPSADGPLLTHTLSALGRM